MLRGIVSLTAGFLLVPLLMRVALGAVLAVWPGLLGSGVAVPIDGLPTPPMAFMIVNLGLVVPVAGLAATVTARLAPDPPYLWVLLLAFFVFAGGLVLSVQHIGGATPTWYLLAMPLASGLAIVAGGYVYLGWRDHHEARRTT